MAELTATGSRILARYQTRLIFISRPCEKNLSAETMYTQRHGLGRSLHLSQEANQERNRSKEKELSFQTLQKFSKLSLSWKCNKCLNLNLR